jgi:hypothetical protein
MLNKNKIFIFIFILIILIPSIDNIFNFSPVKQMFEKRLPKNFPDSPSQFSQFKKYFFDLEQFYNDHYGMRKTLITIHSVMMDKIFDQSPDSRAIIGKDDWMFFDNHNSIIDSMGLIKLDQNKIDLLVKNFINNHNNLKKLGIEYLVIIAPDKSSIYYDYLPDFIKRSNDKNHRIDQFLKRLKLSDSSFPIIDLRPVLQNAMKKEIIYQKTDTHWNRRGAHYAYVEIFNFLAKKNFIYQPKTRDNFIDKADEQIRGDIADIMGIDKTNLNYDLTAKFKLNSKSIDIDDKTKKLFHNPVFYENTNKNLPILFAYKDSFFADLYWLVAEHFSYLYSANENHCKLDLKKIIKYKPNLVIQEFWEGRIELIIDKC